MRDVMTIDEAIENASEQVMVLERAAEHWQPYNEPLQREIHDRANALTLVILYAVMHRESELSQ